ncbi:hypothetical protein RB195_012446 [Necator americanus]|uniref:Profilin n=1 Tax=Necator americanus TaxID=51031 RepID=A0ABR1D750_NECAM
MRFLVVLAFCIWIAYAKDGCTWDGKYFSGDLIKNTPKPIVEAVEKALKKKLPDTNILLSIRVKEEDGKEYTHVMTGKRESENVNVLVFENKGPTLVFAKTTDQEAMLTILARCKIVGDKPKLSNFLKQFFKD